MWFECSCLMQDSADHSNHNTAKFITENWHLKGLLRWNLAEPGTWDWIRHPTVFWNIAQTRTDALFFLNFKCNHDFVIATLYPLIEFLRFTMIFCHLLLEQYCHWPFKTEKASFAYEVSFSMYGLFRQGKAFWNFNNVSVALIIKKIFFHDVSPSD